MDLVKIENGEVYADSFKVSAVFGKKHFNVIRDIEILISSMKAFNNEDQILKASEGVFKIEDTPMEGISNFGYTQKTVEISKYFLESNYINQQNNQRYKMYNMTQDGFSLLVMGFTGQKALEWKLKYIDAFNSMRKSLNQVKELDILNSKEWQLIKGSASSLSHIEKEIKNKLKNIEKIIRSIEEDRLHIQIFSDQALKMTRNAENGELRSKDIY